MKSLPPPARGMHAISPPWSRAILRAIVRPSPVPRTRLERESSTRKNSRNMRSLSFSATPIPRSRTCTVISSDPREGGAAPREPAWAVCGPAAVVRVTSTSISFLSGEYFSAFESRLRTICFNASGSARTEVSPPSAARERANPRPSRPVRWLSTISFVTRAASINLIAYLFPPRSLAEKSSTLLMSRVRRSVSEAMRDRYCARFRASGCRFPCSSSTKRLMDVRGVLSSCETLVTKVAFF